MIMIEADSRRRVSLAKLGVETDSIFLAERRDDGSIVLTPAEVRPKVIQTVERAFPDLDAVAQETEVHASEAWEKIRDEVGSESHS